MDGKGYVDLHSHTVFSDGTFTPEELVALAADIKLKAVAITDHDGTDGIERALAAGEEYGVEVIPGIELAVNYTDICETEIHIVGLFIDHKNKELSDMIDEIRAERVNRNVAMVKRLRDMGFDITYEELEKVAAGDIISRPHYGRLFMQKGYVKSIAEMFDKYIGDGGPAYIHRVLPTPEKAIKTVLAAGGVPVLAHPTLYKMDYTRIRRMADEFIGYGLKGIEVRYSTYNHEQEREITRIADERKLLYSGGSDFHGENKPDIQLGVGKGTLRVPDEFLDRIKEWVRGERA